jgi:phospholipid transport system substrate-binding protein
MGIRIEWIKGAVVAVGLTSLMCTAAFAEPVSPKVVMTKTVDMLVETVEAYPGDDETAQRRVELRKIIEPKFDFNEMAKRSLGSNWNKLSDDEKSEFVSVFSELLARTYLSRIENVRKNMVTVDSEDVVDRASGLSLAKVKTRVTYKGDEFPIDYKLFRKSDAGWKVYDVIIENIGLVVNYRNEFAGIMRKEKFSGLMKKLKQKVDGQG